MVGIMNQNGIIIRRGDSFDIVMQFRTKNGENLNIENCQLKMSVKDKIESKKLFVIYGDIISNEEGKAILKIKSQHTKITPGDYVTDIQLTLKNGDVHTVYPQNITQSALFRITSDVTEE